ncbi:MAG: aryl-sulfate sulfotransferase [Myxococcales bacterium]|nr:aryl-sulfate sulfotransferase [Myxococcales bacterium]
MIVWLAACSGTPEPDFTDTVTSPEGVQVEAQFFENPDNPLSAFAELRASADTTVHLSYGMGDALDRRTPDLRLQARTTSEAVVLGLRPGTWRIAVVVDGVQGQPWSVTTEWPERLLDTETDVLGNDFGDAEAICTAREAERPAYACTDRQGRPTLYVPLPDNTMFVRPLSDGTLLAHPDGSSELVQFDVAGRIGKRLRLDELSGALTYRHEGLDEHEVIELTEGPWAGAWAVLTWTYEDDIKGAGIVVFDPDAERVLWDWSSHGAPDDGQSVDPLLLPYDRFGVIDHDEDWLHANALLHTVDGEGDLFWMSLRHQDWLLEIRAPSGAVTGRLGLGGDYTLVDRPDADWFFHQHAPEWRWIDDQRLSVLLFDNGNGRPGPGDPRSRVLELEVDRTARTATVVFEHGDGFFSPAAGDADRLPDDGSVLFTHSVGPSFAAEVTRQGQVRWTQRYFDEGEVYRSEFFPTLYDRTWVFDAGWSR